MYISHTKVCILDNSNTLSAYIIMNKEEQQYLLAINNYGRIFTLSTFDDQWKPFPYVGMDLKHISAIENYIWSIGGDNQTYLLVHNLNETIRIKEEVFENEVIEKIL
jgi:hypothetical protein